jgi:hypothetical protein
MAVLMVRGFAAACPTSSCCWWCRRCWCCSWCWCRLPSRHVTPQCAFISGAATVAGRGRLTLLIGGKAAVGSIKVHHTPRIILSARSSRKPVVEHDHANGEERQSQSHCLNSDQCTTRRQSYHTRTPLAIAGPSCESKRKPPPALGASRGFDGQTALVGSTPGPVRPSKREI